MPIYEYRCKKCSHPFEVILQPSDRASCPQCGSKALAKQFSVFAVGGEKSAAGPMPSACQGCKDPSGQSGCPYR